MRPSEPRSPHEDAEPEIDVRAFLASELLATERRLATSGECPDAAEVDLLARGEIRHAWRREALARHMLFCRRCLDQNLVRLAAGRGPERSLAAGAAPGMRSIRPLARVAAAAVLVIAAVFFFSTPDRVVERGLVATRVTDAHGLETRNVHVLEPGDPRRLLVEVARPGYLGLLRATARGGAWEPVEGDALLLRSDGAEEVLLPLDHAVPVEGPEDWIVVRLDDPIEPAALKELAPRLLAGERPGGVEVARHRFRP